jgi:ABC-type glycerol-3-phosphate transport system permease component
LPVGIATFQRAGGTIPWELVMPSAVLSSIPIVLLFLFLQKYFITGLTEGAIKG